MDGGASPEKPKDVLEKYPRLREWVETRPEYQRETAVSLIGTIASLDFEGTKIVRSQQRMSLRSGIMAFERVGLRQSITDLEALADFSATDLLVVLTKADSYEAGLWSIFCDRGWRQSLS